MTKYEYIEQQLLIQERNFCPRCGKRLGDGIHTCTPPQIKNQT